MKIFLPERVKALLVMVVLLIPAATRTQVVINAGAGLLNEGIYPD